MPTYTVHFSRTVEIGVRIAADDPDAAIEAAYDGLPADPCAQCGGWGRNWSRTESDESEYEYVIDESGATVRSSGTRWTRVPE